MSALTVVITGGASGIGLATATRFAARAARVACLDLCPDVPEPLLGVEADVTDDASVRAAVATAADKLGGIDVLVNSAGIGAAGAIEDNSDDEWRTVFEVNVLGVVRTTRAALPHLRRSAHPAIVNTCSVAAVVGLPDRAVYSASKGAVLALTRAMATDLLADAIRVTCVNPGTVDTPWIDRLLDAADLDAERAALAGRQPVGPLVTAEEVAAAIAYLASPGSGAVTGTALAVTGGVRGPRAGTRPHRWSTTREGAG